jgi:hypothetical protein
MSLASRFWRIQGVRSEFLLILWNLFPVRSGTVVLVVHSTRLLACGVLISVFSYVLLILVVSSGYEGCCAAVEQLSVV